MSEIALRERRASTFIKKMSPGDKFILDKTNGARFSCELVSCKKDKYDNVISVTCTVTSTRYDMEVNIVDINVVMPLVH